MSAFGGPIKKDKTYYYFSYEVTRRHETGFSCIGQATEFWSSTGLPNFDVSPIFGAPSLGTFPGTTSHERPSQAAFLASDPVPDPLAAAYAFMVGASSGIAFNGSYPAWFAGLGPAAFVPAGLQQFPTSCNPSFRFAAGFDPFCTGLPVSLSRACIAGRQFSRL